MSYLELMLNDLAELADEMEREASRSLTAVNAIRRLLHKMRMCEQCSHPIPWHPVTGNGDGDGETKCHGGSSEALCSCGASQEELLLDSPH